MSHASYNCKWIIMSFRKPCHMPFRKLIPPLTLAALNLSFVWERLVRQQIPVVFEDFYR